MTIELISTLFQSMEKGYTTLQLYCVCGSELDGQRESFPGIWGKEETYTYLECADCGFRATGRDAECIFGAMVEGII